MAHLSLSWWPPPIWRRKSIQCFDGDQPVPARLSRSRQKPRLAPVGNSAGRDVESFSYLFGDKIFHFFYLFQPLSHQPDMLNRTALRGITPLGHLTYRAGGRGAEAPFFSFSTLLVSTILYYTRKHLSIEQVYYLRYSFVGILRIHTQQKSTGRQPVL